MPARKGLSFLCLRLKWTALAVLLALVCGRAATGAGRPAKENAGLLPTLTTTRQAHSLNSREAGRAYPVHLRAVVTYFNPDAGNGFAAMFVTDATGSIWVNLPTGTFTSLPAAALVDVTGVSSNGLFAPVIASPHVRLIGPSHLPEKALRVTHSSLFSGVDDGQWVEVEGTIHSFAESGRVVTLRLEMPDGGINVLMMREAGADYSRLVDAKVQIHANIAPVFSRIKYQMVGARLMAPGLSGVKILEAAPSHPFNLPVTKIDDLARWDHISILKHRVHLQGTVTLFWPGSSLCLRDASGSICTRTRETAPLAVGEIADVIGFVAVERDAHILTDAVYRPAGKGEPAAVLPMAADEILHGLHDSELIVIEGQLIGRHQASLDTTLMLSTGNVIFSAILPNSLKGSAADKWGNGSKLRIRGICSVSVNTERTVVGEPVSDEETAGKSFRVLLRSPGDIVVLQKPSWVTPAHTLLVLTLVLMGTLLVLAWVIVLRRRVVRQAKLLQKSEERFRHMALHDALTGLATRLLLEDRLGTAVEAARRHQKRLALLMIDIDYFKTINDTYGHLGGDEVLRVAADRLKQALRKTDTVARMGGDEFVVLLPDINEPAMAEGIAAKIVSSLAEPVHFLESQIPISASVGVCTLTADELDPERLLLAADEALYKAKARGRNCYHVFTPGAEPAQPAL
jgi:diguanylate cyclase (GGDEF)-like protein